MIDREHDLPITKQAKVLRISRGSVYYRARPVSATDLEVMRRLDRLHLEFPFAGSRMLQGLLSADGCEIGRRHVKTLMQRMGIEALYRRPRTTKPEPGHKIYPYLLRGMEITRPNLPTTALRSAWTAKGLGGTTSSSSGSGAASNMRRCICGHTTASARPALRSAVAHPHEFPDPSCRLRHHRHDRHAHRSRHCRG